MTPSGKTDSNQALYTWLASCLGRMPTQDECDQLMVLVRQYVKDTVVELQRISKERGGLG